MICSEINIFTANPCGTASIPLERRCNVSMIDDHRADNPHRYDLCEYKFCEYSSRPAPLARPGPIC